MLQKIMLLGVVSAACITAVGCGGGDDEAAAPPPGAAPLTVPRVALCATGGKPESALQGQVPASLRTNFAGFNCNLSLVGQVKGEGASWSQDVFTDPQGHTCAYHATANGPSQVVRGVPVIDITNPAAPVRTMSLTTPAMLTPHESLRVVQGRQLLIADNVAGGPEIDIYDLSGDCRNPQLLSSAPIGTGADGGILATGAAPPTGHEGAISRDGLTYYVGDSTAGTYRAIDITNTRAPRLIAQFNMPAGMYAAHGLSVSDDGNRIYVIDDYYAPSAAELADPNATPKNGFLVLDSSEVQARKPGAQLKQISSAYWRDGATGQHTLPFTIKGKQYLVTADETGAAGFTANPATSACNAGLPAWSMARIHEITDDTKPTLVSKFMLETHDVANCSKIAPDLAKGQLLVYGSHYCSVDNRNNATAMACSYFNSGVRVFDIRDPARPKEIAYYNPAGVEAAGGGSSNGGTGGSPDRCATSSYFDFEKKMLTTTCQDNGLLTLKFADGTWPFAESTPSKWQRN